MGRSTARHWPGRPGFRSGGSRPMTDIPPEAVQAAAEVICVAVCGIGATTCTRWREHLAAATDALAAAEGVWPHNPPGRDLASTTATRADLRLPPETRRPARPPPRVPKYDAGGGIGFLGDPRTAT